MVESELSPQGELTVEIGPLGALPAPKYVLPVAARGVLGGVMGPEKTEAETVQVHIDPEGDMFVPDGGVEELRGRIDGLESGVETVLETTDGLTRRTTALETAVDGIDAKVESAVTDKVTGAVEEAKAELKVTTDAISQEVSRLREDGETLETRTAALETAVDGIDAKVESTVTDKVTGAVDAAKAELEITTEKITADVRQLRSDADGLESRTASLEETVNGLSVTVEKTVTDKVTQAVSEAKAELDVAVDGVRQQVQSVEESAGSLQARVGELETAVDGIDARVESAVTDKVTGAVDAAKAELKVTTDAISQEVSSVKEDAQGLQERTAALETAVDGIDAKVESTVTDKVTGAVSEAKAELEMQAGQISQRVESLEETSQGLDSRAAQIETTVDGIKLEVTQGAGADGQVSAKITLTVGPNSYSGYIRTEGNLDVSGQLSADALYAALGDIADLTVDRLSTSRRIVKYLAGDTTDDNFVRIHEQYIEFVTGSTDGSEEQAVNPSGLPIYWEDDPAGAELGEDGYPYRDGQRIFTTTARSDWPVKVYVYTQQVKRSIGFENIDGTYTPVDTFGAGNPQGRHKSRLVKRKDGLELLHLSDKGDIGLVADDQGHLDLLGLRRPTGLDFSGWDAGTFTQTMDGIQEPGSYQVEFDGQGRPVKITDADGESMDIKW